MGRGYIIRCSEVPDTSVLIRQTEPGRCNDIHTLRTGHHGVQSVITARTADRMPAQADLAVRSQGSIFRLLIIRDRSLGLFRNISQTLVLHISDHGIRCLHLAPGLHLLQNLQGISLRCLREDRALHTAPQTHRRILFQLCHLSGPPFGVDLHMSVITIIGIICEQLHIIRRHIYGIPFHETDHISGILCAFCCRIGSLAESRTDHFCRIGVQQQFFRHIRIKHFVHIFMDSCQIKIAYVISDQCLFFYHFVL